MPALTAKEYCTGCTACASACPNNCIAMKADENGFLFPVVDPKVCISCGLCQRACPVAVSLPIPEKQPTAYAIFTKDEALRFSSSSGGVFSEVAKLVLKQHGAVFGAAYHENFEVVHICVEQEAELTRLRGAKYAQSDLGSTFSQVKRRLERGQQVLFSGTPCQVGGLKAYLTKDYENLLTVDFVCHSIPSPIAWKAYVRYRAEQDNGGLLPKKINLRAKNSGWSRYLYSNLFEYADGSVYSSLSGESLYMKLFSGGYLSRESCENCRFKGYRRVSDLTLGDFWGIWDIHPEMDDNKGTSLVLVQSDHGAALLDQLRKNLVMKPVTLEEASRENSALVKAMAIQEKRQEVLKQIREVGIGTCETWFPKRPTPIPQELPSRMRRFFARIKRRILRCIQ